MYLAIWIYFYFFFPPLFWWLKTPPKYPFLKFLKLDFWIFGFFFLFGEISPVKEKKHTA